MDELESDIEHLEEVLKDFKGCDECRRDHERLLAYLKELLSFREAMDEASMTVSEEKEAKEEARLQAECLFEVIKEKAYELCVDLDWYTDEVLRQIDKLREGSE